MEASKALRPRPGRAVKNILFIMADQLRRDYLSCYGARHIDTPNVDALAARGVRFDNCYAQGAVCGVSRMSYYTGRYMSTHGANWNFVPCHCTTRRWEITCDPLECAWRSSVRPMLRSIDAD